MNVTQLDDDGGRKVLQIEAPWSEILADYQAIVTQYAQVRIPGFRPGKTPKSATEQRFKKAIMDDLKASLTQRLGREALRETGIETLGSPEAFEIYCETNMPFRARLRYFAMPEIKLPDLNSLKIPEEGGDPRDQISRMLLDLLQFEVPDEMVSKELEFDGSGETIHDSDAWEAATDRIRLMIILKKIGQQHGIDVDESDVSKRIAQKAEEFGTTKEALQKELEEGGGLGRLRDLLLAESTLEYIEYHVSRGSDDSPIPIDTPHPRKGG
jgi:FKBP-type peptidyl-prolyl cis-trans isomerase (trigger factor)